MLNKKTCNRCWKKRIKQKGWTVTSMIEGIGLYIRGEQYGGKYLFKHFGMLPCCLEEKFKPVIEPPKKCPFILEHLMETQKNK